jgi:nicotinate-nucleotide adenylyltransferase
MNIFSGPAFAGRRIGLLGGSFNPAHAGHRAMSLFALKRLGLHQIWWLVSPQNPLKPAQGMAKLADRLASAHKAARHPRIVATAIEAELGTRYTADTLRALKRRFSRTHFVWLMGADNMRQVQHWRDWQDLFGLVPVAVFRRPAYAVGRKLGKAAQRFDRNWLPANAARHLAMEKPAAWLIMDNVLNPVSSTEIRKDKPAWPKRKRK